MPAPVLDGHLSPGQLAALRLAANGFTSRQIAVRLGTTEQGIHLRLKAASKSLGASSRTHAVAVALRLGLLGLEEVRLPGDSPPRPQQAREGPSVPVWAPRSLRVTRAATPPTGASEAHNLAASEQT